MATGSTLENTRTQTLSSSDRDAGLKVGSILRFPDDQLVYKVNEEKTTAKQVIVNDEHINNISQHPLSAVFGEKLTFTILLAKARFDVWDAIGYGPNIRNFQGVMIHNRNLGPGTSRFTTLNPQIDRARLEEDITAQTDRLNLPADAFSGVIHSLGDENDDERFVYLLPQDLYYAVKLTTNKIADLQNSEYFRFYHHTGLAFLLEMLNQYKYSIHWNGIGDVPELKSRLVLAPKPGSPRARVGRPYTAGTSSGPCTDSSPYAETSRFAFDDSDTLFPENPYANLLCKAKSIGKDMVEMIYKLLEPNGINTATVEEMLLDVDWLRHRCEQVKNGFDCLTTDEERYDKARELCQIVAIVGVENPQPPMMDYDLDYGDTLNELMDRFSMRSIPVIHQVVVEADGDSSADGRECQFS